MLKVVIPYKIHPQSTFMQPSKVRDQCCQGITKQIMEVVVNTAVNVYKAPRILSARFASIFFNIIFLNLFGENFLSINHLIFNDSTFKSVGFCFFLELLCVFFIFMDCLKFRKEIQFLLGFNFNSCNLEKKFQFLQLFFQFFQLFLFLFNFLLKFF